MSQPWWPTPDEARAQLEEANRPTLTSARDRHVHAAVLAAIGVLIGLFTVIITFVNVPSRANFIVLVTVSAAFALVLVWRSRATSTRPLTSLRLEKRAGVTMALAGGLVWTLNTATGGGWPWWMRTMLGLAYGAPYCIAAMLTLRRHP